MGYLFVQRETIERGLTAEVERMKQHLLANPLPVPLPINDLKFIFNIDARFITHNFSFNFSWDGKDLNWIANGERHGINCMVNVVYTFVINEQRARYLNVYETNNKFFA